MIVMAGRYMSMLKGATATEKASNGKNQIACASLLLFGVEFIGRGLYHAGLGPSHK
jgi:hypothetical protein